MSDELELQLEESELELVLEPEVPIQKTVTDLINELPTYLQAYFRQQDKTKNKYTNIDKYPNCQLCQLNLMKLNDAHVAWAKENICKKCPGQPYLRLGVTSVVSFQDCKNAWFKGKTEGWRRADFDAQIYGIVQHLLDEFMIRFFQEKDNLQMLRNNTSIALTSSMLKTMMKKFLTETKDEKAKGAYTKEPEKYENLIETIAFIYASRAVNDVEAEGDYLKTMVKRLEEEVFAPYEVTVKGKTIRFLITGHPDKIIEKEDAWFIQDDKSKARISENPSGISWKIQLGGYSYCINFMFIVKPESYGIIWYTRYFAYEPVKADTALFLEGCTKIAKFIAEEKKPGTCGHSYCEACHPKTEQDKQVKKMLSK